MIYLVIRASGRPRDPLQNRRRAQPEALHGYVLLGPRQKNKNAYLGGRKQSCLFTHRKRTGMGSRRVRSSGRTLIRVRMPMLRTLRWCGSGCDCADLGSPCCASAVQSSRWSATNMSAPASSPNNFPGLLPSLPVRRKCSPRQSRFTSGAWATATRPSRSSRRTTPTSSSTGTRARRALTSPSAARAPSRLASSRLLRLGSLRTDHRGALTWRLRQGALGGVWASVARDGTERTRVCNISCRPVTWFCLHWIVLMERSNIALEDGDSPDLIPHS